ncbi:MAG: RHS repeat-associated core domain-containing protein [Bacteroidales bacterium]|nr:RHS repeat-associated core domain-containing protein [Bacteroidales bacterium]
MIPQLRNIQTGNYLAIKRTLCLLLTGCFIFFSGKELQAQYPYIIEMSHLMIGDATIVAKQEVVHKPGFWAKTGLEYRACIDPNFAGNGTAYEPPAIPGTLVVSPSFDLNYIITTTPQIESFDPTINSYTCKQVNTDITYFDGLGRQLQDVQVMASPGQKDIIKPYSYDFAGRPDSSFLSYESDGQNGQYDVNYASNQKNFIGSVFGNSNKDYGFSLPLYEYSPLNRILKQSAPGFDWSFKPQTPDQEHVLEMDYSINESDVSGWKVDNNSFTSITYSAGQLFVNITKNENKGLNQSITKEYKDKTGKVVLIENQHENGWYQTRYIYDDFGLLRCVVPPKASGPVDNPPVWDLCYYYRYDARHRLVSKKMPGADSVLMIYDKRDRMVMSQDGKMRATDARQWILNCFDQFNRQVMSGIYKHSSSLSRVQMQDHYDNVVTTLNESISGNYNNTDHGYTRYVSQNLCISGCTFDVLNVNYYDNYDFAPAEFHFYSNNGIVPVAEKLTNVKNLSTGSKVKVISGESIMKEWMLSVNYFNNKYRIIQTIADNPGINGRDTITSKYSFDGKLEIQQTKHTAFGKSIEYTENFIYDHRGRMLEHTMEGLPNQPKVMMASMHYDPLGQLEKKQTYSEFSGGNYNPFLQKTDFLYNIRGWLTAINNPDNMAVENDIFAMKLHYYDAVSMVTGQTQYNGNISVTEWATNRLNEKFAYRFVYDKMNRLNSSEFYQDENGGYMQGSYEEKNITYDANGNIQTLDRYVGGEIKIDQLTYNYLHDGNQLNYVQDAMGDVPDVIDYPGGTATTQGFQYDLNGNMTQSVDKGIADIQYSYLNKPELFDFNNNEKIRYIYDGAGNKLAKMVIDGDALPESSLIYAGNFVYDWNGSLKYIQTSEGRLVPDNDTYRFEYFMKDHLGNTRATYAQAVPGLAQVAEYNHYYPFGMQIEGLCHNPGIDLPNNYLYNGKELQPDYDLQWYDYGARFYDPEMGRWHSVDPLTAKYPGWSPYTYCLNNPILLMDPDGLEGWPVTRQWSRSDISGFGAYAKTKIQEYKDQKIKDDCANFAVRLIVGYTSENGLPLTLTNSAGQTFDASSDKYTNTTQYLNDARAGIQAQDIPLNTYGVNQSETQAGDMEVIQYDLHKGKEVDFQHVVLFENIDPTNVNKSDVVSGNQPPAELSGSSVNWPRYSPKYPDQEQWSIMSGSQNSRWNVLNPTNMRDNSPIQKMPVLKPKEIQVN